MSSNTLKSTQALLALGQSLGIEAQAQGEDQDLTMTLQFSDALSLTLAAEEEGVVIFARLGELPSGATDLMETLLSANFFWRDTDGATLSFDPDSRAVMLAKHLPESAWSEPASLRQAIDRFAWIQQSWSEVVGEWTEPVAALPLSPDVGQRV